MSLEKSRQNSERIMQWEERMRNFAQAHKEECKSFSLDIPRVQRSQKRFPTGSEYEGTWDMLGMSGYGVYKFSTAYAPTEAASIEEIEAFYKTVDQAFEDAHRTIILMGDFNVKIRQSKKEEYLVTRKFDYIIKNERVIYKGNFDDGMFHGEGDLIYPDGVTLHTKWKRGELVDRALVFHDGSEYSSCYCDYCKMPDRRFVIEKKGLRPAGNSYLTAEQPTKELPDGFYDVGDGFYDSKTKVIYKSDDLTSVIRAPTQCEQQWIVENCRKAPMTPVGPCPVLYEEWTEPQLSLLKLPLPDAKPSSVKKRSDPKKLNEAIVFME